MLFTVAVILWKSQIMSLTTCPFNSWMTHLDGQQGAGRLVSDFFHNTIGASSEDALAFEVVGLDNKRFLVDRNVRP